MICLFFILPLPLLGRVGLLGSNIEPSGGPVKLRVMSSSCFYFTALNAGTHGSAGGPKGHIRCIIVKLLSEDIIIIIATSMQAESHLIPPKSSMAGAIIIPLA